MLTPHDISLIRNDFPLLAETVYGQPLVYLDNAATTQKPACVLDTVTQIYSHCNANIHRGVHFLSQKATETHEAARATVAAFLGAAKPNEVVFTRGTTEAINLVAFSFGESFVNQGDEIIVGEAEHHSNIVPWQMLCNRKKLKLTVAPIDNAGEMDLNAFGKLLSAKTKLVAIAHVSNVLGTVNPVEKIIQMAHARGVPVLVDGAQAAPHISLNVREMDADFYVFSGHKIYAPTGIGVLYGKERWLEALPPYQGGGEMIEKVSFEQTTYNTLPFKFEAGTPDYVGSAALATAIKYLQNLGIENIAKYEQALLHYATDCLLRIPEMKIYGSAPQKAAVLSFNVGEIHPYDLGVLLDQQGVAVRTGHHCAQPLMQRLQVVGTLRASLAFYNTFEEIDRFIAALKRAVAMLS